MVMLFFLFGNRQNSYVSISFYFVDDKGLKVVKKTI